MKGRFSVVRFVIGRAGTGKTTYIHSAILAGMRAGVSGQILLVPEQYSHTTERRLAGFCGDSLSLYAEVLTFRRLAPRVLAEEGGLACVPMDGSGRIILLKGLLSRLNGLLGPFRGFDSRPAMIKNLMTLIDELKSYRVTPSVLADLSEGLGGGAFSSKLQDIALILEGYEAELKQLDQNGCDTNDIFSMVAERLENSRFFEGREVYADCFAGFDPKELGVVERIIAGAKNVTITLCADPADTDGDTGFELFSPTKKTLRALIRICERVGAAFELVPLYENHRQESAALKTVEQGFFDYAARPSEGGDGIEMWVCGDIYAECAHAAARVAGLIERKGWRCRDFAVIVRDISAYEAAISQAFSRAGLPVFIDRTEDILQKPAAAHILGALDCIIYNFSYEHLFSCLGCGFSGVAPDEIDLLKNYCYKWGLSGAALSPEKPFTLPPDGRDERLLERLDDIKNRAVSPLFRLKERLSGEKSMQGLSSRLIDFLEEQGFEQRISERAEFLQNSGNIRLAAEYSSLWEAITAVFDQCLMAGSVKDIDIREFRQLLALALSQRSIGVIPTALDGVRVGEAERIRGDGIKCAIIMGANEGSFPLIRVSEGLISDRERELLLENDITLAPTGEIKAFEEQFVIYQALCSPSHRLIITVPERAADGSPLSPSFLFGRIEDLTGIRPKRMDELGFLPYAYSAESLFEYAMREQKGRASLKEALRLKNYGGLLQKAGISLSERRAGIGPELAKALYGSSPLVSASSVETMAACRFANFAARGLRAEPRKRQRFEAPQVGDFVHSVLDEVCVEVERLGGWKAVTLEQVLAEGKRQAAQYQILWFTKHPENGRTRHLFRRLGRFVENMLKSVYIELCQSLFQPVAFELDFSETGDLPPVSAGEDGRLRLRGRVDRVDGFEKNGELYIRVIDYKTGGKAFDLTEILNGMGMQMLIYLFALEKTGLEGRSVVPAGVLYIPGMNSPTVDLPRGALPGEIEKARETGMRRMGLVLDDEDIVKAMEPDIRRRFIPVKATKEGYDAYSSVASPKQMKALAGHVEKMLTRLGGELKMGYTQVNPYRRGPRNTACDYCEYKPVCLFDQTGGDRFRALKGINRAAFWEAVEKEAGQ